MATFTGPVTIGSIIEPACVPSFDLAASGYVEEEFFASGMASAYELVADDLVESGGNDGRWVARAAGTCPFCTRVVVRRPERAADFSGTVLVEWLNQSSGFDADPDWAYLHEEILRAGHAYAGVSAQALGIMGGKGIMGFAGPFPGLRASGPDRYGPLQHPGDTFAFDIFGQVGMALRGGGFPVPVLGGLAPEHVVAVGESQSAFYLNTFVNAVQPLAPVFDGFLVHSRGAGAAPLDGAGLDPTVEYTDGMRIRADTTVPVMVLEAEGDIVGRLRFSLARQPDSDRYRLWEVAGTAHADAYLLGAVAPLLGFDWPINSGPHRFVAQAALHALDAWVRDGTLPPLADRIQLASADPATIARDGHGIALGGVRTPAVDVPVAVHSGEGPPGRVGFLVGETTPLAPEVLRELYGDRAGYLSAFTAALDAAIAAGFLLPAHRAQLLAEAQAVPLP
jgi:hypothetical protein